MILRITDGTTTVNLTGGTVRLANGYVPKRPDISTIEAVAASLRDGGELKGLTNRNVTEAFVIAISGAAWSTVESSKTSIETLLEQAERYQKHQLGARVYVEYSADDSTVWRSELLYGKLQPDAKMGSAAWLNESAMRFTVTWRRRFYWEGAEVELALENNTVYPRVTGGVTVVNHDDDDVGDCNWVAINGGDVSGLLPAGMRLEITNTYATAGGYSYWVGHNVHGNPASLVHVLEGEDADYKAGAASATAHSGSSGGETQPVTWSGGDATRVMWWTLDDTFLSACGGLWFRVLARFTSMDSDVRLQVKSSYYAGTVLQEAQEVIARTHDITDLGALRLPPWLPGESGLQDVELELWGRKSGGGSFSLDFLMLMPAEGFRAFSPLGYGLPQNATLVDDGILGKTYVTRSTGKAAYYVPRGLPIMLIPGSSQRLYFLCENWSGDAEIDRTHSIRVYARPRILTL